MTTSPPRLVTRHFVLLTGAAFAYFIGYATLIPTLPAFVDDALGRGDVAIGVVSSAFALSALLFRPFVGAIGDRRGRRVLLLSGTALVAVSVLGITLVSSIVPLILLRFAAGAGEAMVFVSAASAISDMSPPERRGEALSLFSISLYGGVAIGPALGEFLLDHGGSEMLRSSYTGVWVAAATVTFIAFLLAIPTPDLRPEGMAPGPRHILHPAGRLPGTIMLTSVIGFAGTMAFLKIYVTKDLGMSGAKEILAMYGVLIILIRLFGARIPDRFGVARVGLWGLSGSALGLVVMGSWRSVTGVFVGIAIYAVGQALSFPAFMALAANLAPPNERGAAVGTTTAFIDLGFFIGPLMAGFIADRWGDATIFLVSAAVAVIGVAIQLSVGADRFNAGPATASSSQPSQP